MNRRKFSIAFGFILGSLFIYSKWIEPTWIEITRHQVFANTERPLKIIQLSDLHTFEFGTREKNVLEIIRRETPDAILLLGDTIANEGGWWDWMTRSRVKQTRKPLLQGFLRMHS